MDGNYFIENTGEFIDDFATKATLDGIPIKGIFDKEFTDVLFGHEAHSPVFMIANYGVTVSHGSVLIHDSITYAVREIHNDGTGMSVLLLEKQ